MFNKYVKSFFPQAGFFWLAMLLIISRGFPEDQVENQWQVHTVLTDRLRSEWFRIGLLKNQLADISELLNDIRDFQIYPDNLTHLDENRMVAFDRQIEKREKNIDQILTELNQVSVPLSDALAILREMVAGQSIEDMFIVIEQGDMKRLAEILSLKHRIDKLWQEVDLLIEDLNQAMGLPPFKKENIYGLQKEFFDIINSNLGLQADKYHHKIDIMKNIIMTNGTKAEIIRMYKIDLHRIKQLIKDNKNEIAKKKLLNLQKRYHGYRNLHESNILLSRVYFALNDFTKAREVMSLLPDEPAFIPEKVFYITQCHYALGEYEKIWSWAQSFDFSYLVGKTKNLILWLVMESGYRLNREADYALWAEKMSSDKSCQLPIYHTLARSYLRNNQASMALSILDNVLKEAPEDEETKQVYDRIFLTRAQVLFEVGEYDRSLHQFFKLLNQLDYFEEALFGISRCYLALGKHKNAETSLRKLINQSPQSHRSAEAILTMSKRFINKAQYEWNKTAYLVKEQARLEKALEKITANYNMKTDPSRDEKQKYEKLSGEIREMLDKINEEGRKDFSKIRTYYTQAINICKLVATHYETGSFQEFQFSAIREHILHQLDSTLVSIKNARKKQPQVNEITNVYRHTIQTIKQTVEKSYSLNAEMQLNLYKWEDEYLNWEKMLLSTQEMELEEKIQQSRDSLNQASLQKKKEILGKLIDSLVIANVELHNYWFDRLSTTLTQLLETSLPEKDEIYFRYQLGELYYQKENRTYTKQYETFEREMNHYDSLKAQNSRDSLGSKLKEPEPPNLSHEQSMAQFKEILKHDKDSLYKSATQYSLAWCYNDLRDYDSAVTLMRLVSRNQNSSYAAQAWMYLGEYFFENARLDSAIFAYRSVMKYPESEWFDDALYKLAWTQYRLSNPEKAISSFLALVDLGKQEETGKALLETESIDYIAISFSESDIAGDKGLQRALTFCKKISDQEKAMQILHRLGDVYKEQGRNDIAKKTYRILLKQYPQYHLNPSIEHKLIGLLSRDLTLEDANKYKLEFYEKYQASSSWARNQKDQESLKFADSVAASLLYEVSVTYHQMALQKNSTDAYNKAIFAYRKFVTQFPHSPLANECHYNLAEILFSLGRYREAVQEYITVSRKYPQSKYREIAAWNAIVASQHLIKEEKTQ